MALRKFNAMLAGIIAVLIVVSCQKETQSNPAQDNTISNKETVVMVNVWLDTLKTKVSDDRPLRIQSLQQNLDFNKLWFEDLFDGEKMIVIPVNKSYQTENNKGKNPINCLLLIVDKTGKIRKGNIVQYIPVNRGQVQEYPVNFFSELYSLNHKIDGALTFLTVSDDLLYEMNYKKGSLTSYSKVKENEQGSGPGKSVLRTNIECYDVWWVTYYPDGSSTWEYLYSFCNGGEQPCRGTINANGRTYRVGCGGGSGDEPEVLLQTQKVWDVYKSPDNGTINPYWSIRASTYLKGKKVPGDGYFTSVDAGDLICYKCGLFNVTWNLTTNWTTFGHDLAMHQVAGNYSQPGEPMVSLNEHRFYYFATVFP